MTMQDSRLFLDLTGMDSSPDNTRQTVNIYSESVAEGDPTMPEISRFFGIIIAMFYDEHNPPHFHARYGEAQAAIEIASLRVLEGRLPPRALGLVIEWASLHQEALMRDWFLARDEKPPEKIAPLA